MAGGSSSTKEVRYMALKSMEPVVENGSNTNSTNESQNSPGQSEPTGQQSPCTSINIQQLVVYNFGHSSSKSSSPREGSKKLPRQGKLQSNISSSSGPICRICHEGDAHEELVSPCNCAGSVGLVHITCMEQWLSASNTDGCELCQCKFVLKRSPRSFAEWLRSSSSEDVHRSIIGDIVCFVLLTPLAAMSSFMCINGALTQAAWKNIWEASSLVALAAFLITIYFGWSILAVRYHYKRWRNWRLKNQQVRVLSVVRRRPSLSGNETTGSIVPGTPASPSADSSVFLETLSSNSPSAHSQSMTQDVIMSIQDTIQRTFTEGVINPLFHMHDLVRVRRQEHHGVQTNVQEDTQV